MKKITALLSLISLIGAQVTPALAHIGGPYSNNTYDGFQGGIFHGTMTSKGLFGIFRFSTGFEPVITGQAQSVVMVNGLTLYGECFGFVDFTSRSVAGITNSLSTLPNATTGLGSPSTLRNGQQDYVVNTNWQCKMTTLRPVIRFRGKGVAMVLNERYEDNIATVTDRIEAAVDIPGPEGTVPGSLTSSTSQTITDSGLAPVQQFKLRVTGSRLTPIAYTSFGLASPSADARN